MAQISVITSESHLFTFTDDLADGRRTGRHLEFTLDQPPVRIQGERVVVHGQPRILVDSSAFRQIQEHMVQNSDWTVSTTAAGASGRAPAPQNMRVAAVQHHGGEGNPPTTEALVKRVKDLAIAEANAVKAGGEPAPTSASTAFTETLGVVVQTSFNVSHFGKEVRVQPEDSRFDPDLLPPEGGGADPIFIQNWRKYDKRTNEDRKDMKVDSILATLEGSARENGRPIDIASFHEVNNIEEFRSRLQGRSGRFGIDIKDGGFDGSGADTGYVLAHGPHLKTGGARGQNEYYPLLFDADKFKIDKVSYILTHGDGRGDPIQVPTAQTIMTGTGDSRPLVVYTLKSKEKPGAPPLNVAVVHTKPEGGGKVKEKGGADQIKNRRKIYEQVRLAYEKAKNNADSTGELWTFIGDHYLADDDVVAAGRGRAAHTTFKDAVTDMGLKTVEPVNANTNTNEKIDTSFNKAKYNKSAKEWEIKRNHPDYNIVGSEQNEQLKEKKGEEDRSGASFLDRSKTQVADKAVITSNLVVDHGGIVYLDVPGDVRHDPDDPNGPPTFAEHLAGLGAGKFIDDDADHSRFVRTLLVSDHAMFVLVTSDDPADEQSVHGLFQSDAGDEADVTGTIFDENLPLDEEDSEYTPSGEPDVEEEEAAAELEQQRLESMSLYAQAEQGEDTEMISASADEADDSGGDVVMEGARSPLKRRRESSEDRGEPSGSSHVPSAATGRSSTLPGGMAMSALSDASRARSRSPKRARK